MKDTSQTFSGTLQSLRSFVVAYEERSFTAAAVRRSATQSGVSQHVRQLESQLNIRLFERDNAGVSPTAEADALYPRLVEILADLDEAASDMARFRKGEEGRISVGLLPALARAVGGPTLLRFSEVNPNVTVRVVESLTLLPQMIRSGDIDFAIASTVEPADDLYVEPLLTTPECLVSRGSGGAGVSIAPLPASVRLVSVQRSGKRYRDILDCLAGNGVAVTAELEIPAALACFGLVTSSDWHVVMSCVGLNPVSDRRNVTVSPLRNPALIQPISLIGPASVPMSAAGRQFVDMFVEVATEVLDTWKARLDEVD